MKVTVFLLTPTFDWAYISTLNVPNCTLRPDNVADAESQLIPAGGVDVRKYTGTSPSIDVAVKTRDGITTY
jgi:hypothetical protein